MCRRGSVIRSSQVDARALNERRHPIYALLRRMDKKVSFGLGSHDDAASCESLGHESHRRPVPFPGTGISQAIL